MWKEALYEVGMVIDGTQLLVRRRTGRKDRAGPANLNFRVSMKQ